MDEVDRPLLVWSRCCKEWLSHAHQAFPFLSSNTQSRSTIDPKQSFVIHNLSLSAQKNPQTTIAVTGLLVRQLCQLRSESLVFLCISPIAKAGSGDVGQLAGFALTGGEVLDEKRRISTSVYELRRFFIRRAFSISRSKLRSATNRFRRLFSSSK